MGGPGRRLGTEGGEKLECLSLSSSGGVTSAPLAPTAQVYPGSDSLQRLQLTHVFRSTPFFGLCRLGW